MTGAVRWLQMASFDRVVRLGPSEETGSSGGQAFQAVGTEKTEALQGNGSGVFVAGGR